MTLRLRRLWELLRRVTGDDAYERWLAHCRQAHAHDPTVPAIGRAAFFREEQRRKWDRINRCC